jgi:hypothetical protein
MPKHMKTDISDSTKTLITLALFTKYQETAKLPRPGTNQTYQTYTRNKYTRHMPNTGIANLPRIIIKLYKNELNRKKLVR